jgi:hypothetical protein
MTPGSIMKKVKSDLHEKLLRTVELTIIQRMNPEFGRMCQQWVNVSGIFMRRISRRDWWR